MNHHQGYFSLVDVLPTVPLCSLELFSLQVEQIVLDLEGHSHVLNELNEDSFIFFGRMGIGAYHAGSQSG